ncbi:MAG: hypothetical protein ABL959_14835 [Pyrinomonadaceae bacterium]
MVSSTFAIPVAGQTKPTNQEEKTAKVKERIRGVDTKVPAKLKIKMNDRTKLEGTLHEARDNDFIVADKTGSLKTVPYSDVDSVDVTQASTKAKIIAGVVVGVAAGIVLFFLVNESKR